MGVIAELLNSCTGESTSSNLDSVLGNVTYVTWDEFIEYIMLNGGSVDVLTSKMELHRNLAGERYVMFYHDGGRTEVTSAKFSLLSEEYSLLMKDISKQLFLYKMYGTEFNDTVVDMVNNTIMEYVRIIDENGGLSINPKSGFDKELVGEDAFGSTIGIYKFNDLTFVMYNGKNSDVFCLEFTDDYSVIAYRNYDVGMDLRWVNNLMDGLSYINVGLKKDE